MRPWLCSNDHPREAGGTSVTHIANAHRTTIARPTKLPTFLLYSTVPVAQSAAVSLNLGWNKARRYVIKRTPIVDKDDQQLYLDDGLRQYVYWIVVSNSKRSNEQVLRIAQGRGNQENLIKDFKYGLGLAHIPTGSLAANQAYFMIAALAWNLKTWLLNLLDLGDGAVMRFQRFRYLWIWQAGVVAMSGRNTVVLKLPAGEYFQRFGVAMARLATL